MKSILLVKKFLGLVEMTSGLVNASFSLPEWQAVKMIFFVLCHHLVTLYAKEKNNSLWCFFNHRKLQLWKRKPWSSNSKTRDS